MKKIILMLCLPALVKYADAQSYGTVGSQKIDSVFIESVQLLNPEFALSPKTDVFTGRLEKYYIFPTAAADEARKRGLDKDPQVKAQIELVKKIAEDKLLDFLMKTKKQETIEVTEAESRAYYNEHQAEFTPPAVYSYLHAYIYDTSAVNINSVKQKLETYSKDDAQLDEFKMGNKESYTISFEKKRTVYPTQTEYKVLSGLPVKKVSQPVSESGMLVMYCITSKTDNVVKPYEEVKENCKTFVQSDKQSAKEKEFRKAALNKYPVQLDKYYFGQ